MARSGQSPLSNKRFQAQLGDEYVRRYKEGQNIDRIIMARVIKVNYKYNTVDVVSVRDRMKFEKNPNNNGKFSARLPVQFGGRDEKGKPFGTNTLATVGSLVLIGFIEGSKNFPIVLNIYGELDNQSQLTRTELTGGDEKDEDVQQELWQLFSLYPSMTYKNIDGHGNQEVTFTGRTFMYITDMDEEGEYVGDTSFDYDHLPSAHYQNGDLIEPNSPNAPTVLYVHQGVNSDHRTTFFIKPDGTLRVGSRHVHEDGTEGVTFQEMKTDGSFSVTQKEGTARIEEEVEKEKFSEINIDENGDILLKSRRNKFEVTKSGVYVNGNLIGSSLDDKFDKLEEDILDAKASIDIVDGRVELKASRVELDDLTGMVKDQEAELTVAYNEIKSKVSRTEFDALSLSTNNLLTNTNFKKLPTSFGDNVELTQTEQEKEDNVFSLKVEGRGSTEEFGVYIGENNPVYMEKGEVYTLSFEGDFGNSIEEINYIYVGDRRNEDQEIGPIKLEDGKQIENTRFYEFETTFEVEEDMEDVYILLGVDDENRDIASFEIRKVQLEEGDEATDWGMHHLDFGIHSYYETEIKQLADEISLTATSLEEGIDELGDVVDGHTTRIREAELKIAPDRIVSTVRESQAYSDDLNDARNYAKELMEEIETEIDLVGGDLGELNEYLDGAFRDGVVSESEAKAIETHIKRLESTKGDFDSKYNEVYEDSYLEGDTKADLKTSKVDFDSIHDKLIEKVEEIVESGKVTAAQKQEVNTRFAKYDMRLSDLSSKLEKSARYIESKKMEEAENNAKAYTDGVKKTTDTEISQLSDEIKLRATEELVNQSVREVREAAEGYAKELNDETQNTIDGINDSLGDLSEYLDGAFKDGVIDDTEVKNIERLTKNLNIEKSEMDAKYEEIYNSSYLKGDSKTKLKTAKNEYNESHDDLISEIENIVDKGKVSSVEMKALDTKFNYYEDAIRELSKRFEKSIDAISTEKVSISESNVTAYIDGIEYEISEKVEEAEQKITPDAIVSTVTKSTEYNDVKDTAQTAWDLLDYRVEYWDDKESPEGAQAKADRAERDAKEYSDDLNEKVEADIESARNSVSVLAEYVDETFKKGVMDEAQIKAMERMLGNMEKEKDSLDARYNEIYGHKDLSGSSKTKLKESKDEYNSIYNDFVSKLEDIIDKGKISSSDMKKVDNLSKDHKNATKELTKRFEKANDFIGTAKVARMEAELTDTINGVKVNLETEIAQTAEDINLAVTQEIEGISVGGRNLIEDSSFKDGVGGFVEYSIEFEVVDDSYISNTKSLRIKYEDGSNSGTLNKGLRYNFKGLKVGEDYTFSFYGKGWTKERGGASLNSPNLNNFRNTTIKAPEGTEDDWVKFSFTVNPSESSGSIYFRPNDNKDYDFDVVFNAPKLERGDIATDWSPAPEDLVGKDNVLASINLSKEGIKMEADRIDFAGKVFGKDATFEGDIHVKEGDFLLRAEGEKTSYSIVPKTNLLYDGSFEMIEVGTVPDNTNDSDKEDMVRQVVNSPSWGESGKPKIHAESIADSKTIFGKKAAVVNRDNYFYQNHLNLKGGGTYTLSAHFRDVDYKSSGGTPMLRFYIKDVDTGNSMYWNKDYFGDSKVTSTTKRHSLTVTLPNLNYDGEDYYVGVDIRAEDSKYVIADGVQLVEGEVATTYQENSDLYGFLLGNGRAETLKAREGQFRTLINEGYIESTDLDLTGKRALNFIGKSPIEATVPKKGRLGFFESGEMNYILDIRSEIGGGNNKSIRLHNIDRYTTGNSANLYVSNANNVKKSTSSKKYKEDIERIDSDVARKFIEDITPVYFRGDGAGDENTNSYYGYLAESVARVDKRLVEFSGSNRIEGVAYDRVPALHHIIINEEIEKLAKVTDRLMGNEDRIDVLKMENRSLKRRIERLEKSL